MAMTPPREFDILNIQTRQDLVCLLAPREQDFVTLGHRLERVKCILCLAYCEWFLFPIFN